MKCVIFAGGFGTRLSEMTDNVPKPMVPVGQFPILWHIMKLYSHHGIKDFVICLGYKQEAFKHFFANYAKLTSDFTIDLKSGEVDTFSSTQEDWRVTLVDTGLNTMTGGRLKRVQDHLDDDEPFLLTYGDGVGDVDISATIDFHKAHGGLGTVTATTPPNRFGVLDVDTNDQHLVRSFQEKKASDQYRVNAGFFVLSKKIIDYIEDDSTIFEKAPLEGLTRDGQLHAYLHDGFWMPMDTLRDYRSLCEQWESGQAKWKVWE